MFVNHLTMTLCGRLLTIAATVSTCLALGSCASEREFRSVPVDRMSDARPLGEFGVRTWADEVSEAFQVSLADGIRESNRRVLAMPEGERPESIDILALSGGADDGAYGAGLLCGWSENGDRPVFRLVTGISTGALIAPLAFLGSEYDDILRKAYTTIDQEDVASTRSLLDAVFSDGFADTDPLGDLIQQWITPDVLEAVARGHEEGRRLFVQTVNLEAQRGVIWDLGAIAASRHPRAADLFRQIMLASASVPAAFEPQYVSVTVDGEDYEEMHVDGGAVSQVFLWGFGISMGDLISRAGVGLPPVPLNLWVIRNGRMYPEYQEMQGELLSITGRAVSTMIKAQGLSDVSRIKLVAESNNMNYHLTSISEDFTETTEGLFEKSYMNSLFDFGYARARGGDAWVDTPPLLNELLGR